MKQAQTTPPASFAKRLLAIIYDSLILFFVIVIVTILIQQIVISFELVPLEKINDVAGEISVIPANSWVDLSLKNLWVVFSFLYFAHYWTRSGQTPGMKVWKVKLLSENQDKTKNQQTITVFQALQRYVFSLLGFGLFWIIFDRDKRALQDRLSQSHLVSTATSNNPTTPDHASRS